MTPAISFHNVSKHYGQRRAVDDLNLEVQRGEVLGFLGPNGAGKTTTIRLLAGFLRPTAGIIRLLGCNMAHQGESLRARQDLGFVPDVAGLDPSSTGMQLMDELAQLQGRPPIDRSPLCSALNLNPHDLKRPIGSLSRGTRQKINIVQGLQHRPQLLVLDEPTEALDPLGKHALFEILRAAHQRGATIFFSSHVLSEVEELCDRVALIRDGQLIAVDHIEVLRRQLQRKVSLLLQGHPENVQSSLAALPTITDLHLDEGRWHFNIAELPALLQLLATMPVQDLTIEPPSLADVFLRLYRHEKSHE